MKDFEEGDKFKIEYGKEDTWKCPVCGHEKFTNYDAEDMEHCPECKTDFEVYTVQEIKNLNREEGKSEYAKLEM